MRITRWKVEISTGIDFWVGAQWFVRPAAGRFGKFERMLTITMNLLRKLKEDRRGVTAIEYGLITAFIAVVIIVAVKSVGTSLSGTFNKIASTL